MNELADFTNAIELKNVNFSTDDLHIIKNVSGAFPEGEITTLVGPSGAGKSTLFKLLNGLRTADSGEIIIHGKNINTYPPVDLRRHVGLALQSAPMINGTVYKNLALPLTLNGKELTEETAKELLHLVGLEEELIQRKTKDLSGGQRQKLSIARTLVNRPKILLLDEITSSLDRISQQDIEELIVRINEKYETTIIWITHNLEQALNLGHYTWFLKAGELIESGPIDVLKNPTNEEIIQFVKGEAQ